jgi:hypothetical protein
MAAFGAVPAIFSFRVDLRLTLRTARGVVLIRKQLVIRVKDSRHVKFGGFGFYIEARAQEGIIEVWIAERAGVRFAPTFRVVDGMSATRKHFLGVRHDPSQLCFGCAKRSVCSHTIRSKIVCVESTACGSARRELFGQKKGPKSLDPLRPKRAD